MYPWDREMEIERWRLEWLCITVIKIDMTVLFEPELTDNKYM